MLERSAPLDQQALPGRSGTFADSVMPRLLTASFTVRIRAPEPSSDLDSPSQWLHNARSVHEMCTERRNFGLVATTGSQMGHRVSPRSRAGERS